MNFLPGGRVFSGSSQVELFFKVCYLRSRGYNDLTIVETKMLQGEIS